MMTNPSVIHVQNGAGCQDLLELKISIQQCHKLFLLLPQESASAAGAGDDNDANSNTPPPPPSSTQYWLSYRCFGKVIQSELFSISDKAPVATTNDSQFAPTIQTFRIKREELSSYFNDKKNVTLRIHLCTEGNVIATAAVDLGPLIKFEKEAVFLQNECSFKPRTKDIDLDYASCALVAITLSLDESSIVPFEQQQQAQTKSVATQTTSEPHEPSPKPTEVKEETDNERCCNADDSQCRRESKLLEKESQLQMREDQLSKKEKAVYESLASLDKKRFEWEQLKHQEELTWQEKLRNKEAEIMFTIEERITLNEKERLASIEKTKSEYETLEKRLHKAIVDVETKDRSLKELQEKQQHEYKHKLAELDLREKLIKQEMTHSVAIEQGKAKSSQELAVVAEKAATAAAKKLKQLEAEMDELREKHRKTPEAALMQQIAELKGQLADSERRIEAVKAERNEILQDKEKFRVNVKKLAKALRQEREKAAKSREQRHQNVRLSYDDSSGQFVLGGEQDEVHRILSDLSKLTQKQETTGRTPVPLPSPLPSRPLGIDDGVFDNIRLSFLNEAKHNSS